MMLVLPILVAVFLGLATVASMFMGNMAVSQAAQQGVQALASGQNTASVDQVVQYTLSQDGYRGTPTTSLAVTGDMKTVTVSMPYSLWNTGGTRTLSASRTITTLPTTTGAASPPAPTGGNGGGGGGGYVYHHFPMW